MGIAERYGRAETAGYATKPVTKQPPAVVTQVTRAEFDALITRFDMLEQQLLAVRDELHRVTVALSAPPEEAAAAKRDRAAYMRDYRAKRKPA